MSTQAGTTASQGMFGNLGNWWDEFGGSFTNAAGTAASIYGALDSAKDTKNMGAATQDYLGQLGANLQNDSQFQGYGVSSGLGNGSVVNGPNGVQVDLGMNQQAQNQMNNMQNNYALNLRMRLTPTIPQAILAGAKLQQTLMLCLAPFRVPQTE